jgi:cardiolipin synthase
VRPWCTATNPRAEAGAGFEIVRHLPNIICLIRLALIWPILTALHAGNYPRALVFFIVAAASDGVDGYLAKRFNWTSELGKFLDPLADKLLIMTVFVEAAWLAVIPWWITAAVVARDVMIGLGALIYRLWFGPLHGRPTRFSKVNTAAQLLYISFVLLNAAFGVPPGDVLAAMALLTLLTTVLSGVHYVQIFTRRAWAQPPRTA